MVRSAGVRRQQQRRKQGAAAAPAAGKQAGSAKKRARALQRLLKRQLPDEVRKRKETELASLQQQDEEDAAKRKRTEREKCFSRKYRKIKFFERRKVERQIALLEKALEKAADAGAADADSEQLSQKLEHERESLLYIGYFPRHKKYLSLFPKDNSEDPFVTRQRTKIRKAILKRAANGQLAEDAADESESEDGGDTLEGDDFFAIDGEDEEADE